MSSEDSSENVKIKVVKVQPFPCSDGHKWRTLARLNHGWDESYDRISWCSRCGAVAKDICFDGRSTESWRMHVNPNQS